MKRYIKKPRQPQFLYFLEYNPIYNKLSKSDYDRIYEQKLKEATEYHNEIGKYGFLSERTYEFDIPIKATREAKREIERSMCEFNLNSATINTENYMEVIDEVENNSNFYEWCPALKKQII